MLDSTQMHTFVNGVLTGLGTATASGLIYFIRWAMNPAKSFPLKVAIGKALHVAWCAASVIAVGVIVLENVNALHPGSMLSHGVGVAWLILTAGLFLWVCGALRGRSPWR